MRITTKSIMQGYNRNLNLALGRWNTAQNRVLTQRNFNTIGEDPAAANRAFQLRRQFRDNATQMEMTKQTQSLMDEVTSSAMQISKTITTTINPDALKALNGTSSESERKTYAETLRGMQQSIVLSANSQVSGRYLFGGTSTKEPPFVLSADGKTLTYRGQDVNDKAAMEPLTKDALYIDLGFGIVEKDDKIVENSAFNSATPGINMLGYGKDAQGYSNNVIVLLGQMADELESETFDQEKFRQMVEKFQDDCVDTITDYESGLGVKQQFLSGTLTRLNQYNDTLNERIIDIEKVDMPEAISNYIWQGYAYNAALKVGTNIVSQSLIDFMR